MIARETNVDNYLGQIVKQLEMGQSLTQAGNTAPEESYTLIADCLTFGHTTVIPTSLRKNILNDQHATHLGMVKMIGHAHSFVYWPGIDKENRAKICHECAIQVNKPPTYGEHHWEYPTGP